MSEGTDHKGDGATHTFQAEVSRLLDLMVHSVYTEREVFLRELISNASDACDKQRFEAIAKPELMGADPRLAITISSDKAKGTLTIADNGIGMSKAELIDNLGTIARSGTRAFLDGLGKAGEGSALIGQFGVGFYSAFMVASAIEVVSRKAGSEETWAWISQGPGGFRLEEGGGRTLPAGRGTTVTLTLKDDALTFLEAGEIERVVKTYSDHILFPVELATDDGKQRQLNSASALWQRTKSQVKPEEYKEVYQTIAGQFDAPAHIIHWRAEGRLSYAVLLFVPESRPFDLFDPARKGRVKLYVRRVFITEGADLLPSYLRFVRGVVDSEDMPLNVSREMLQNNPQVAQIRRALTTRVLSELATLGDKEPDKLTAIWDTFGPVIKEGIYEEDERRDEILKLARFRSTAGPLGGHGWRTLTEYVAALRPGQGEIYYLTGENLDRLKASPQLEAARARGIEVLLLADPVDSFWTTLPLSFEGKPLKSLSKGEVDLTAIESIEPTPEPEPEGRDIGALIAAFKTSLGDAVSDVRASKRLVDSAACLVAEGRGPDRALERLLARQSQGVGLKPILEINPRHALVKAALAEQAAHHPDVVHDIALLLLDQAHILEGELPADTAAFATRVNRLIAKGLGGN